MFGDDNKGQSDYDDFHKWHKEQWHITQWCFKDEMRRFCEADVELLAKAIKNMLKQSHDVDPFRYVPLSFLVSQICKNTFLP